MRRASPLFADRPFRVDPDGRVGVTDVELAGVVARDHGPGDAPGPGDGAPDRALRGDLQRVWRPFHAVDPGFRQMGAPFVPVGQAPTPVGHEPRQRLPGQLHAPHQARRRVVDGVGFPDGAEMAREGGAAFRARRPEMREDIVADHRAVPVHRPVAGAGVVDGGPPPRLHAGRRNLPLFVGDRSGVVGGEPHGPARGDVQADVIQQGRDAPPSSTGTDGTA